MSSPRPEVHYAKSGDVSIAYSVFGEGPIDLVFVTGFVSNLLYGWEQPRVVRFFERLAPFARTIRFDRRGGGLSDRPRDVPTLETRMDDVRAVMDAVGSEKAVLVGTYEAAAMTALFAATYPEKVPALVMYNPYAKGVWAPDYPWARTADEWRRHLDEMERGWGTEAYFDGILRRSFPSVAADPDFRRWFFDVMVYGASPGAALTIQRMAMDVDVRDVLPVIRVPTLILHAPEMADHAKYMADRIPGARRYEHTGVDGSIWLHDEIPVEIERFVRSVEGGREPETVLSTVLFTDIVGSTEQAAAIGDAAWRELLERHHAVVRRDLDRFRGRELDTAGDGFFATFDGPARGIRCALAIRDSLGELGLEIRAGLHTGECEVIGEKVGGIAVNIGARIAARAEAGELLVSSTVKDLVAGSGIEFADRGAEELKGVPGSWQLYSVVSG